MNTFVDNWQPMEIEEIVTVIASVSMVAAMIDVLFIPLPSSIFFSKAHIKNGRNKPMLNTIESIASLSIGIATQSIHTI